MDEHWDINDLADAHEVLDIKYIIEKQYTNEIIK